MGLFLVGLICGFCSSSPLGPINLWVVDSTLDKKSSRDRRWFITGVVTTDICLAAIAFWGYFVLFHGGKASLLLGVLGGCFLVIVGAAGIIRQHGLLWQKRAAVSRKPSDPFKNLIFGVFMCGSNPAFLMFWVFVANIIGGKINGSPTAMSSMLYLLGIGIGDVAWFSLLIALANKGIEIMNPRLIKLLRLAISGAFIVFGAIAMAHNSWHLAVS